MKYEAQVQVDQRGRHAHGQRRRLGHGHRRGRGNDRARGGHRLLTASTRPTATRRPARARSPRPSTRRARKTYDELRAAHVADYRKLFDRVELDVGQKMPAHPDRRPAGTRTRRGAATADDRKALEALYFQYGRYLLDRLLARRVAARRTSRACGTTRRRPPWERRLPRQHQPPDELLAGRGDQPGRDDRAVVRLHRLAASRPGEVTAHEMFGSRRLGRPQRDQRRSASPACTTGRTSFWFPEAGAWLAQHCTTTTASRGDERVPARPRLPGDEGGGPSSGSTTWSSTRATASSSSSPQLLARAGRRSPPAPSMSQQIVWDLFTNTRRGRAESSAATPRSRQSSGRRWPSSTRACGSARGASSRSGRRTGTTRNNNHRHVSHLFALHPGRQIAPLTTPQLTPRPPKVSLTRPRRRRHRLEQGVEDQLLGAAARRRPRAQDAREQLKGSHAATTCGTPTRRSRSTATSAPPPASPRCCCRASTRSIDVLPALPVGLGARLGAPACAPAATSPSTSSGRARRRTRITAARGQDRRRSRCAAPDRRPLPRLRRAGSRGAVTPRSATTLSWNARPRGGATRSSNEAAKVTVDAPAPAVADVPFAAEVDRLRRSSSGPSRAGTLKLTLPEGWTASPAPAHGPPSRPARPAPRTRSPSRPGPVSGARLARLTRRAHRGQLDRSSGATSRRARASPPCRDSPGGPGGRRVGPVLGYDRRRRLRQRQERHRRPAPRPTTPRRRRAAGWC